MAIYVLVSCSLAAIAIATTRETYATPLREIDGRGGPLRATRDAESAEAPRARTGAGVS